MLTKLINKTKIDDTILSHCDSYEESETENLKIYNLETQNSV